MLYVKTATDQSMGTQAYTALDQSKNRIVVAFRGSSNIPNWVENIDMEKKSYSKCYKCEVHHGFQKSYNSIKNKID